MKKIVVTKGQNSPAIFEILRDVYLDAFSQTFISESCITKAHLHFQLSVQNFEYKLLLSCKQ